MGKGKPRHDLNKKQNKYGKYCSYYEKYSNKSEPKCEISLGDVNICKGNPHNCVKTKYHKLAIYRKE